MCSGPADLPPEADPTAGGGPQASAGSAGAGQSGRDDVVDAEFEEVKDKDRRAS
jgi:hypothetical protein